METWESLCPGRTCLHGLGGVGRYTIRHDCLWYLHVYEDAHKQEDHAGDGGCLAELACCRQASMGTVHCQAPFLNADWGNPIDSMVQENMADGVHHEKEASEHNADQGTPSAKAAFATFRSEGGTSNIPYDKGKEDEVGSKGEVVGSLAIGFRSNAVAHATEEHGQQQRPASGAQQAGNGHQKGEADDAARSSAALLSIVLWTSSRT